MLFRAPDKENEEGRVDFATEDFSQRLISEVLAASEFLAQLRRGAAVDIEANGTRLMRISLNGVIGPDWPEHFQQARDLAETWQ